MKAICINSAGDLEPCDRPAPVPGAGEVLIKVAASGMNRADLLQTKGLHPPPPGASDLPGLEVSGTIHAVGPGISEAMIGERVCALLDGGGYAEYAVARLDLCLPVPRDMDLIACAGLPEAIFTVTKNVFLMGQLRPDEHLLIHGGASGIGTLAIQMAKSVGAFVTVTAGTDAKCQLCRELGADRAINYKTEDFVARFRRHARRCRLRYGRWRLREAQPCAFCKVMAAISASPICAAKMLRSIWR